MNRTIYFPKSFDLGIWTKAQRIAQIKNTTLSEVLIKIVVKYTEDNQELLDTVDRITNDGQH